MSAIYWCDRCHASGIVDSEGSVHDVVARIESAHDDHDLAQDARCLFSVSHVQVKNRPEMVVTSRSMDVTRIQHDFSRRAIAASEEEEDETPARRKSRRGSRDSG